MTLRIYIKTLGCQMNEHDSHNLLTLFRKNYVVESVDNPNNADILILNTCAVREKASEKVFSQIGEWKLLKNKNPEIVICVGGCVAIEHGKNILKRAPAIDVVFGPQTIQKVPEMVECILNKNAKKSIDLAFESSDKFKKFSKSVSMGVRSYVSIMEGCDKFCSYCIVPFTRGPEISRPLDDIIIEIDNLSKQGVKEIILLGQNVNSYSGVDRYGKKINFAELIYFISEMEQIKRISYTSSHPISFDNDLIFAYSEVDKLIDHVHLPVQSGSNKILKAMNRGYKIEEYEEKINLLRKNRPNISITSDFIFGFPGETEKDFLDTIDLIERIKFDFSYCFMYSSRPNTKAAMLDDDIPKLEKKKRLWQAQTKLNENAKSINSSMLNSIQNVLVCDYSKKNNLELNGRTYNNKIVNFSTSNLNNINSSFENSAGDLIGNFINVKLTELNGITFKGEII